MRFHPALLAAMLLVPMAAHADEAAAPEQRAMFSPPLLVSGVALSVLGTLALPFGILTLSIRPIALGCAKCPPPDNTSRDLIGAGLLAGGALAILASAPMMIVGARRVPIDVVASGPLGSAGLTVAARF